MVLRPIFLLFAVLLVLLAAATASAGVSPNDPYWAAEWAEQKLRLPALWGFTVGDPRVVIAVVDTGVRGDLPDLPPDAFVAGHDFVDNSDPLVDYHGHGSFVATEIAGRGNNNVGTAGYCWLCRIMPIKAAGSDGVPVPGAIAAGIRWAADHGATIINVSFNGTRDDAIENAVIYAQSEGSIVVASGGNSYGSAPTYPAAYHNVIGVAATDENDVLYPWSTRGAWLSLAAPGCQVATTPGDGNYGILCGTSVTAPAVSGVIGLLLSLKPSLTFDQLQWALRASAVPVAGLGGGRVDAYGAAAKLGLVPPTPPPDPPIAPQQPSQTPAPSTGTTAKSHSKTPAKKARRATSKYSTQAQITLGTIRRRRSFAVALGRGGVQAEFASKAASQCTLTLSSQNRVVIAARTEHTEILLSTIVATGRYVVDVRCQTSRPARFSLSINGMLPAS
jgi:subtilisin family serine protease